MNKFLVLFRCEEKRLLKYGITFASLVTALIWVVLIQIIDVDSIDVFFPLLLFVDATMMAFLLTGVGMIFEKQENALKTLLVTPIGKQTYLLSKITTTIVSSVITLVIMGTYGILFKNLSISYAGIAGAVMLASFVYACFGILFTYMSKDFTTLLMYVFVFSLFFSIPTVFQAFGIITADWFKYVQYANPSRAVLNVMNAAVRIQDNTEFIISLVYLIILGGVLYYFALRRFDTFSAKEYGGE